MNALAEPLIQRIVRGYGLNYGRVIAIKSGYRNVSHIVQTNHGIRNLILYKNEPGIAERIVRLNNLGDYLHAHGLPVRYTADTRIVALNSRGITRYASMYNYLPGETIAWEMYSMKHIKLLGWVMADLHAALRDYHDVLPSVASEYRSVVVTMRRYFMRAEVQRAMRSKLGITLEATIFDTCDDAIVASRNLPSQALHMDFVRGNLLFSDQPLSKYQIGSVTLCGVLDLEKAATGPIEFDVARTLAFLLVDSDKSPEKVTKYFIDSGYIKRGGASRPDMQHIDRLVDMFLMYDLYKFLRDNPYESLGQNHHFRRTRGILCQRQMIQYSK